MEDFQKNLPSIAERLRTEQYWNKDGDIRTNKFTCEDFSPNLLLSKVADLLRQSSEAQ